MVADKLFTSSLSLKMLVTVVVIAAGVLVSVGQEPQAQSALADPCDAYSCVSKTASPNPANVGQQITFTIDLSAVPPYGTILQVTDTLPAGVTPTDAAVQEMVNGSPYGSAIPCTVSGQDVRCPPVTVTRTNPMLNITERVTIHAAPSQCGSFTNTANTSYGPSTGPSDSVQFAVAGCPSPPSPPPTGGGGRQQQQQPATPITQAPAQTYVSGTNTNNAGSVQTGGT